MNAFCFSHLQNCHKSFHTLHEYKFGPLKNKTHWNHCTVSRPSPSLLHVSTYNHSLPPHTPLLPAEYSGASWRLSGMQPFFNFFVRLIKNIKEYFPLSNPLFLSPALKSDKVEKHCLIWSIFYFNFFFFLPLLENRTIQQSIWATIKYHQK